MAAEVLSVLTYKSVKTRLDNGGTQSWALDRRRAKACRYVVVCRNANNPDKEGFERHGQAFLIATIKDVVPSTETKGRWLVLFGSYVEGDFGDQWQGRNPVAYWYQDQYTDINFDELNFRPIPDAVAQNTQANGRLSIKDAKQGLALSFGVDPSCIEITIKA